jgi:hypothetical protein
MKIGVPCLALGIGLLAETSLTQAQTSSPALFAQLTGSVPPSGSLTVQPPAPVLVSPSGVLPAIEGRQVTKPNFKTAQNPQTTRTAPVVRMRRHAVHRRSLAQHEMSRRAADQSIAATAPVARTTPEHSSPDGTGYEFFLHQLGKGKE